MDAGDAVRRPGEADLVAVVALPPAQRAAPVHGTVLLDARGADRALRVSWHDEDGLAVLSVWRGERCTATFRLEAHDVPALVEALVSGLVRGAERASRGARDVVAPQPAAVAGSA
jgi:hypothetical protein